MSLPEVDVEAMSERLSLIRPHLDQRAWRLLLGAEAKVLGRGGITVVSRATGAHPDTVAQGVRELDYPEPIPGRIRRPGAGRSALAESDPGLVVALDALVDPETRGDPESALRWTTKSTTKLAAELTAQGHKVSATTVAKLLKELGYSLQGNSKTVEGKQHQDRDAQFRYLNEQAAAFQAAGDPVISVDTKKKELSELRGRGPGVRTGEAAEKG
jgi:Rhodopirellula transposase.